MALARSKVYRFFHIDCDKDISADTLQVSLDNATWVATVYAAPSSTVQAQFLIDYPILKGLTRYWFRVFSGPDQAFAPRYGAQTVHGRLTDNPEMPYLAWELDVPTD